jgi:hypothetical protein
MVFLEKLFFSYIKLTIQLGGKPTKAWSAWCLAVIVRQFLLGLRQICGFDVWGVAAELNLQYPPEWFDHVCELEDAGLVRFDGKVLSLAPPGWLLANGVTEELLWPTLLSTSEATP